MFYCVVLKCLICSVCYFCTKDEKNFRKELKKVLEDRLDGNLPKRICTINIDMEKGNFTKVLKCKIRMLPVVWVQKGC